MNPQHDRPAIPWPTAAAEFVLTLSADDLPPAPWEFGPGRTIVDSAKFLTNMQMEIRIGPSSPTAFYGALQKDIQRFAEMFQRFRDQQQQATPPTSMRDPRTATPPPASGDDQPSARRKSPASQAAAERIKPCRKGQQQRIIEWLQQHENGTRQEISKGTGIAEKSITPRVTELIKAGHVRETNRKRPTDSGCLVPVLELTRQPKLF